MWHRKFDNIPPLLRFGYRYWIKRTRFAHNLLKRYCVDASLINVNISTMSKYLVLWLPSVSDEPKRLSYYNNFCGLLAHKHENERNGKNPEVCEYLARLADVCSLARYGQAST